MKSKTKQLLKVLIPIIENKANDANNLGLYTGLTGELLFLWQASQFEKEIIDVEIFNNKFNFLQENLSTITSEYSLGNGISGVGWFLEFINQAQKEDYEPELCESIDNILLNALSVDSWHGEIEMLLGISGLAIYGARRLSTSNQTVFYEKLISHLEKLATHFGDSLLSWQQPNYSIYRLNKNDRIKPEYNLGLAHGVPGIIAALLPAFYIPTLHFRVKKLLIQSCDWLLQQQLSMKSSTSYFSCVVDSNISSRLGWCYGDLSIALILFRVGKALGFSTYMDKAKEISLHAALRSAVDGQVNDAAICHGSAGITLIFHLLYKEMHLDELQQAADRWLGFTLKLYDEKGIKGLDSLSGFDGTYKECSSLLEGYAGIGLCLLAVLNEETDWADCLLLSQI